MASNNYKFSFHAILSFILFSLELAHCQKLTAAAKHPRLRKRGSDLRPGLDGHDLYFSNDFGVTGSYSSEISAARVSLEPKFPTLILDDVDDHIRLLTCTNKYMIIHFHDPSHMAHAEEVWNHVRNMVFITSHSACAEIGFHQPFTVSYLASDESNNSITLSASPVSLQDCTKRRHIEYGPHVAADLKPRSHRRNLDPRPARSTNSQSAAPATTSIAFPGVTGAPGGDSVSGSIDFAYLNTTMLPPSNAIANQIVEQVIPPEVILTCLNCTAAGSVTLRAAGFSASSSEYDEAKDFLENGYIEFAVNGFNANISLELSFLPGFTIKEFNAKLPSIPLTPFDIAGVIIFGPIFTPLFPISVELNSEVNISSGFTVKVPDDSRVILNISDITQSSSQGFENSTLDLLPFGIDAPDVSLNFTAAMQPELLLSASVGKSDVSVSGGVGLFFDTPQLVASVTIVDDVNDKCEPVKSGGSSGLIHVVPSYNFGGGTLWQIGVDFFDKVNYTRVGQTELEETSFPLPTSCFTFDKKTGGVKSASGAEHLVISAWAGLIATAMAFVVLL